MPISTRSNDTSLKELLEKVHKGKMQLPEFQRSWIWDDTRIRAIIASITQGYPVGAILCLEHGNPEIQFKCRTLEGVNESNLGGDPEYLILDGQQRLTSIYQAAFSQNPVNIKSERKKQDKDKVFYYLLMEKCFDEKADRIDAVISVPADKKLKENFDRDVILDLSTPEKEYEQKAFPLNIVFDSSKSMDWTIDYTNLYSTNTDARDLLKRFKAEVLDTIIAYKLPVISIPKEAPREAVCKMFENVNTGGVSLTVFELLTAMFATHKGFNLRDNWEECRKTICGEGKTLNTDLFDDVDATTFLTAVTLYTSYVNKKLGKVGAVSCKKKDVLDLRYEDYETNSPVVVEGFVRARNFLLNQCVFRKRDLPYTTQLIPLAAIFAALGNEYKSPKVERLLPRWFWCGILGEMYGGANETRYVNDIEDVMGAINGDIEPNQIRTINSAFFSATRLLTLQSRVSAAYKGILALLYMNQCQDFVSRITIDKVNSMTEPADIHHIFPEAYCEKMGIERRRHNSIVNKTPMLYSTNRSMGGRAPKDYLNGIKKKDKDLTDEELKSRVESHCINYDLLSENNFDKYFVDRAKNLLTLIEGAMGKKVADRGSDETIREFGQSLV